MMRRLRRRAHARQQARWQARVDGLRAFAQHYAELELDR